ncbi:hypothetical protein HHL16_00995 [Pseudoflavitalea sp. G-6-1-2]|uniref:SMI1/KNR4 family protein n=1 Tax=Pseudoflavitalea sp. G-6-1-2 TaxID=2728841 RepID=UPI00146C6CBD|nr:SMI1/KNR4 family protein [Pseudoflavitalea sp. G-6-1-2]NML19423.1 hypothetical protein [Pseudoflavitalea sp. G-6-1-2]
MYEEILEITKPIRHTGDENALTQFPPSYQQFAKELGYGLLCGLFIVYIPFPAPHDKHPDSFPVARKRLRSFLDAYFDIDLEILKDEKTYALLQRAEPFAKSENGEFLFWDKDHPNADGEWPIYLANFPVSITHVANSLPELISKLTNAATIQSVMQFTRSPLQATFSPYDAIRY